MSLDAKFECLRTLVVKILKIIG